MPDRPNPRLKPCPFCGGAADIVYYTGMPDSMNSVSCSECSAHPWPGHEKNLNVKAWNTRAPVAKGLTTSEYKKLKNFLRRLVESADASTRVKAEAQCFLNRFKQEEEARK